MLRIDSYLEGAEVKQPWKAPLSSSYGEEEGRAVSSSCPQDRDVGSFHCCDLKECLIRTVLTWVIKIMLYLNLAHETMRIFC